MKNGKIYGLCIADIHFGKNDPKRLYHELEEIFFKKIEREGEMIDFIQVLGDTFDRQIKMTEEAGRYTSKFILTLNDYSIKYNFKLRFLKGTLSHDFNQLELYRRLEVSNPNLKIIKTVTEEQLLNDNLKVLYIPEEYMEDPESFYEPFMNQKYDFVFVHGTFDFAGYSAKVQTSEKQMKNAPTFKVSDFKENVLGRVICGHVHTRMNKGNVYYCGSFSRNGFGEEEDKGFYEMFYDTNSLKTELNFIVNDLAPKYITIDLEELDQDTIKRQTILKNLKEQYDFIRIKSTKDVSNEEEVMLLKELSESDSSIKVEVAKNIQADEIKKEYEFIIKREYDNPTTIQKFIKLKYNKDLSLDVIKEIIKEEK